MLRGQESLPGKARRASARTNRSRRPVPDPRRISKTRNRDGISSVRRSKTPNQGVCRTQVRPRDGAPESDRLHVLFYVPHSSAPKNSGKRPGRQRKSKLFATWCAIVFDCISMTGAKRRKSREAPGGAPRGTGAGGTPQAWQYLPASSVRRIVGGTSAANCSREAARYTNERARFRRWLESRRGATHRAPLRRGTSPGSLYSPLGWQRMWRPLRLLSRARLFQRGGVRSRSRARWRAGDAAFPSSLP
jgi:hypothetical protein